MNTHWKLKEQKTNETLTPMPNENNPGRAKQSRNTIKP
jgi:hypothetical protein